MGFVFYLNNLIKHEVCSYPRHYDIQNCQLLSKRALKLQFVHPISCLYKHRRTKETNYPCRLSKICKLPTLTRTLLKRFLSHQTTAWEDLTGHAYELMPMINKEGQRSCRCNMLCSHSLSVQEIVWGPLPLVCSLIRPINI